MNKILNSKLLDSILNNDKLPDFNVNVTIENKTLVAFGVMLFMVAIATMLSFRIVKNIA